MEENLRYFIVFYIASGIGDTKITGSIVFTTEGSYLNKKLSIEQIEEKHSAIIKSSIVFTNIIELSLSDYNDYIA